MSASNQKKLRKEQTASKMTARQEQEQKEAKKLKRYTVSFVAIIAIVLVAAIAIVSVRGVVQSGMLQKKSIAAQIGDNELNAVEFSYYYLDTINETYSDWYSEYSSSTPIYVQLFYNLDMNQPLEDQMYDATKGITWSDQFASLALEKAKRTYMLCDLAAKANYTLSEEAIKNIDSTINYQKVYAAFGGYTDFNKYLGFNYCYGASEESFRNYLTMCETADAYLAHYAESLSYTDEQIREYEKEKAKEYNSYSYSVCYLKYDYFLGEKAKDENGKEIPYTEEQKEAARAKAKEVAESLKVHTKFEDFEMAVNKLEINKETKKVTAYDNPHTLGSLLTSQLKDWITDTARQPGDTEVIVDQTTTTVDKEDSEGEGEGSEEEKETITTINGYYVVIYHGVKDNKVPTSDVRHLLIKFAYEGGTKGEDGNMVYSDAEKAAAKEKAQAKIDELMAEWAAMEGGKTEENFIELVKKHTEDTASKESGGLIENISYDQNLVENFLNWSIDESRKPGDIATVESEYGLHIMYYVETNEMNYRDLLVTNDMRSADADKWYEDNLKLATAALKDLKWINTSATLGELVGQ